MIGVTQPRRIAALSVSEFIAKQMGTTFPGIIGYKMRFADQTNATTKIKIMTDGILLQEMKLDPNLSRYDCLIVDEAHERSLNIDFILGLLKRVLEVRPEVKVIVSSATINAQVFSEYFGQCPIVRIDAVTYPVSVAYEPLPALRSRDAAEDALLYKIACIIDKVISEARTGDVLVFLPGEKIIKDCIKDLSRAPFSRYIHLVPLYGRLGKDEQERVFQPAPSGRIKVVVTTNIAETSVTIDGITTVIDTGLSKLNFYNPRTFTSSLVEGPISKASANQRKGRAGRTQPGACYRLYSRKDFENRTLFTTEEIYRTDLSEVVLEMADLGVTTFEEFDFISPPSHEGLLSAVETLKMLDALEDDNTLSKIGSMLTQFPLAPRHSRIIVEAMLHYPDGTEETIIAAAFLSTQSPYLLPPGEEVEARQAHHTFRDRDGDFVSYLRLYSAYHTSMHKNEFCERYYLDERAMAEISNVVEQLEEIVSEQGVPILSGGSTEDYLAAVARGLIQFVCVRESEELYRSLTADHILIHPGSVMFRMDPQFIVAGEIIRTSRMYASSVSPLSAATLEKVGGSLRERLTSGKGGAGSRGQKAGREWINSVKIGNEVFTMVDVKGTQMVDLPWERLSRVLEAAGETPYRSVRGFISVKGAGTVLEGEKLSLILALAPLLDIDNALERKFTKRPLESSKNLPALIKALPAVLTVAKRKKQELGFVCLATNGEGRYRLRVVRNFHNALNESLSAVETLIDELGEASDPDFKNTVNTTYRRLSEEINL
jgi:HrpA-like RNA helicase